MKKIVAISTAVSGYLTLALPTFAATPVNPCPSNDNGGGIGFFKLCTLAEGNLGNIVATLITAAFVIAVLIALAFLIYGGIRWITSGGDKAGVESARNIIVAALVGLVIVFLAFFIINFILHFFQLGSISGLQLPTLTL